MIFLQKCRDRKRYTWHHISEHGVTNSTFVDKLFKWAYRLKWIIHFNNHKTSKLLQLYDKMYRPLAIYVIEDYKRMVSERFQRYVCNTLSHCLPLYSLDLITSEDMHRDERYPRRSNTLQKPTKSAR